MNTIYTVYNNKIIIIIGENPCAINNGGCAHLCLLSLSDERNYTCACHTGAELHPNSHDCIGMHKQNR